MPSFILPLLKTNSAAQCLNAMHRLNFCEAMFFLLNLEGKLDFTYQKVVKATYVM
jgi:hypothetical protein